jgi:cytochrome c biogenesis protein ResB
LSSAGRTPRNLFGDVALVVFLVAQLLDGLLTYIGVSTYGPQMEGNPIIAWLIAAMGEGPALATAKVAAGAFGIALHLSAVHRAVAMLAGFYLAVAVFPWMAILFYYR